MSSELPGTSLDDVHLPGHWLLARLGKRVLRPGGIEMTHNLLRCLNITENDDVLEFAPGLGITARHIIKLHPKTYTGVERDENAARWTQVHLPKSDRIQIVIGTADKTNLSANCCSVLFGEAMLSMSSQKQKEGIVDEAFRLLKPGGVYGIHELCIVPDNAAEEMETKIVKALSSSIHVGVRPLKAADWCQLLKNAGFEILDLGYAPMNLLQPIRIIQDEGLIGAINFAKNVISNTIARKRVFAMKTAFDRYKENLKAMYLVARKPNS
ncbi:class I SAM-dependent methyltransferase [bacterium]|nr:class I SAM-dependent methyltransferase [bacterium]QQR56774.1 MAG: class I SAM-dependent methyltransferase [Candidatus Melainabacteria bacterium]